jgi:hypothetical protein
MRFLSRRPAVRLCATTLSLFALLFGTVGAPLNAATVTGNSQHNITFTQTPTTGFNAGKPYPLSESYKTFFAASGVGADQVDGVSAFVLTFVASTPQSIDLTALTDQFGQSITCARVRAIAFKVQWQTDNVPLLVGAAGSNPWTGFLGATSVMSVFPSSSVNDGYTIIAAPQTTGMPVSSGSKILLMNPQTAAGTVVLVIATCST